MARRLKLGPLPEPATLPPGVRKTFHAYCAKCRWCGPHREDASLAGFDYAEHKKVAERFVYPCSRMHAQLEAEDKRMGRT